MSKLAFVDENDKKITDGPAALHSIIISAGNVNAATARVDNSTTADTDRTAMFLTVAKDTSFEWAAGDANNPPELRDGIFVSTTDSDVQVTVEYSGIE